MGVQNRVEGHDRTGKALRTNDPVIMADGNSGRVMLSAGYVTPGCLFVDVGERFWKLYDEEQLTKAEGK